MTLVPSLVTSAIALTATLAAAQRPGDAPAKPDPADRGGEFVIVGCLTRPSPQPAGGPLFVVTNVTAQTGEARLVGAMGAGVPTNAQQEGPTARPTAPPDIVASEYRVVADDADIDLGKHVNHKVRMRGALMGRDAPASPATARNNAAQAAPQGAPAGTFMAGELDMVAETCS